jgi:hypothetical protein
MYAPPPYASWRYPRTDVQKGRGTVRAGAVQDHDQFALRVPLHIPSLAPVRLAGARLDEERSSASLSR